MNWKLWTVLALSLFGILLTSWSIVAQPAQKPRTKEELVIINFIAFLLHSFTVYAIVSSVP